MAAVSQETSEEVGIFIYFSKEWWKTALFWDSHNSPERSTVWKRKQNGVKFKATVIGSIGVRFCPFPSPHDTVRIVHLDRPTPNIQSTRSLLKAQPPSTVWHSSGRSSHILWWNSYFNMTCDSGPHFMSECQIRVFVLAFISDSDALSFAEMVHLRGPFQNKSVVTFSCVEGHQVTETLLCSYFVLVLCTGVHTFSDLGVS